MVEGQPVGFVYPPPGSRIPDLFSSERVTNIKTHSFMNE